MDDHSNRPEIIDAEIDGEGFSQRFSNTLQIEQMYLAIPVYNKNKKVYLRLSVSIKELNLTIEKAQKQVFLASIWIAIIILIASYLFSKTVTSPYPNHPNRSREICKNANSSGANSIS